MFSRTLLSTLILISGTTQAAPPDAKQIERLCDEGLKAWNVPGLAVVLVNKEKTLYLQGHGVREMGGVGGAPVTADTIFPLASCSKAFTAALVGMLTDDELMGWDEPVSKYVKDFHLSDPAADKLVTLRDLLSHRTGVNGHDLLWYRTPWGQDEAIKRVSKLPLTQPFRGGMQYQSIMYMAAGRALEKASGKSWETLLHERLLQPLGMKSTTTTTTAAFKEMNRAVGYRSNKEGKQSAVPWYEIKEANAAGSINSNVRDLAHWLRLHLNDGLHGETRVISEEAIRETRTPQIVVRRDRNDALSPDSIQVSYGLGWVVQDYRGRLLVQHAGLIDGFRAHLALMPNEGFAWAILANHEGTRMNLALSNTLADLLTGLPAKDWNKHYLEMLADEETAALVKARREEQDRLKDTTPSVPLADFAGKYSEPAYGEATIRLDKERLIWEWSSWKLPLEHYHNNIFRLQAEQPRLDRAFVRFTVRDGKVRELHWQGLTFKRE
jgi:CubicO group peptidase (beta-lactamase class C family)